jgi:hypothetical protein
MRTLIATVFGLWAGPAAAFCGTYVGSPGVELTNQTSQVIIARQGSRTTLTLANDYQGDATDFAMLIPVPAVMAEEDIRTVSPELFQRFDNYSAPRLVTYECEDFSWEDDMDSSGGMDGGGGDDGAEEAPSSVVVEAEYAVGIYDIVILSSSDSSDLIEWLAENGYGADPQAEEMLGEYIDDGQLFFAAKVDLEEVSDEGSFLEPLQFSYESDAFALPVRLGTLNSPGEQDVVMYILTDTDDGKVGISNYPMVEIEDECMVDVYAEGGVDNYYGTKFADAYGEEDGAAWMVEYAWATGSCDPCPTEPPSNEELEQAGYAGDRWDSYFTRLRVRYTPEAATQDIMLYTAGYMDNEQIRYILYNEDMEDRHPVCGIGMVDDPGTCDDESGSDSGGGSTGGGGSGGGSTGDDGGAGDGGAGDGSGSEEGSEWEQSGIEVTELGDLDSSSKSGCSHTGHRSTGLGWTLILGMMALFGRRRQSAG